MPLYDYLFPIAGPRRGRPMSESKAALTCTACGVPSARVPGAPRLNLMPHTNRIAETRNEKGAHEPGIVHRMAGHDSHAQCKHAHNAHAGGHGRHPSPRPWMLGH